MSGTLMKLKTAQDHTLPPGRTVAPKGTVFHVNMDSVDYILKMSDLEIKNDKGLIEKSKLYRIRLRSGGTLLGTCDYLDQLSVLHE